MAKIEPLQTSDANAQQQELLDQVKKKMGGVPNILATMAHAPAVLQSYLSFSGAMGESSLSPALRERISLAVGQRNTCDYCLAAHTALGKMAGLSEEETIQARKGEAATPMDAAAVKFALRILETNGFVTDGDHEDAKAAGLTDQQIIEIVAMVALNILTNLFNHVVDTEVDFPAAPAVKAD